jgi:hypothetical protein
MCNYLKSYDFKSPRFSSDKCMGIWRKKGRKQDLLYKNNNSPTSLGGMQWHLSPSLLHVSPFHNINLIIIECASLSIQYMWTLPDSWITSHDGYNSLKSIGVHIYCIERDAHSIMIRFILWNGETWSKLGDKCHCITKLL